MLTSSRSIRWIESLADQERSIHQGELASIDICLTKDHVLESETTLFLRDIYAQLASLIRLFNDRVPEAGNRIILTDPAEPIGCFSLSRNYRRMNVLRAKSGSILFQCDQMMEDERAVGVRTSMLFSGSLEARFGAFHEVEWFFVGSRATTEQIARHYLTEFIQVSRCSNRGN